MKVCPRKVPAEGEASREFTGVRAIKVTKR